MQSSCKRSHRFRTILQATRCHCLGLTPPYAPSTPLNLVDLARQQNDRILEEHRSIVPSRHPPHPSDARTARYFCKYCNVTINDDKPSREQHDNGLRHKGNVDRYITGLYKKGAQQKKDKEEEAREIKRIEQVRLPFSPLYPSPFDKS